MTLSRNFDERIGLVILEHDIVARFVLLNEVNLQEQGLNIGLRHDKFEVLNFRNEGFRLGVMTPTKIRPNPIFQIFSLTHINNLAIFIFMKVATRAVWQQLQFMFNEFIHRFILPKKHSQSYVLH
ncbi:Uncharacterised protein [Chlamydia trachomatis]|nr:Uncharacterised protein [Chlamydia trachomatis]